ncbi:hypothetical protein OROMI_023023 [Orobanche minor]
MLRLKPRLNPHAVAHDINISGSVSPLHPRRSVFSLSFLSQDQYFLKVQASIKNLLQLFLRPPPCQLESGKRFRDLENDFEDLTNAEAMKFYRHVREGKQPLYPGCTKFSRLSFMIKLYHLKCIHGITESAFGELLQLIKDADRYLIPDDGKHWVFKTINRSWRTYKSRMMARYYTKYETDEERMNNRPNDIPLEDFKVLVNYWGDESIQDLAKENKERRNSMNDPHTLGANSSAQVGENLKKGDPNATSPSAATVYLESRDREEGRTYKTAAKVQKRNSKKKKKMAADDDSESAPADPYLADLTAKIRGELEAELEEKVNIKVKDNLSMVLKRIAESNHGFNLGFNLDLGEISTTLPSEDDENGTPLTAGPPLSPFFLKFVILLVQFGIVTLISNCVLLVLTLSWSNGSFGLKA